MGLWSCPAYDKIAPPSDYSQWNIQLPSLPCRRVADDVAKLSFVGSSYRLAACMARVEILSRPQKTGWPQFRSRPRLCIWLELRTWITFALWPARRICEAATKAVRVAHASSGDVPLLNEGYISNREPFTGCSMKLVLAKASFVSPSRDRVAPY